MDVKEQIRAAAEKRDDAINVISLYLGGEFVNITPEESVSVYVLCQNWRDKLKPKTDVDGDCEPDYKRFCELNRQMQTHFLVNEMVFLSYGKLVKRFSTAEAVKQFCQMANEMVNVKLVSNLWQEVLETLSVE